MGHTYESFIGFMLQNLDHVVGYLSSKLLVTMAPNSGSFSIQASGESPHQTFKFPHYVVGL